MTTLRQSLFRPQPIFPKAQLVSSVSRLRINALAPPLLDKRSSCVLALPCHLYDGSRFVSPQTSSAWAIGYSAAVSGCGHAGDEEHDRERKPYRAGPRILHTNWRTYHLEHICYNVWGTWFRKVLED